MHVIREDYLAILDESRGMTSMAKILTGMRYAGKTTVLEQYIWHLRSSGIPDKAVFYMNMDIQAESDLKWLFEQMHPVLEREDMHYILIDEIQNVDGWERLVAMLVARRDCDIYLTCSNSGVLSSELCTKLSGRYIEIDILPFSFSEYLLVNLGEDDFCFDDYLRFGPLPMAYPAVGAELCGLVSEGALNTVLMKDVLAHTSGKPSRFYAVCRFLFANLGRMTNPDRVSTALGIPKDFVYRCLDEMLSAHLFYHADRYDIATGNILPSKGKYYATDIGMRSVMLNSEDPADGEVLLENTVYFELRRRGYKVWVGNIRGYEVDFVVRNYDNLMYFQVAWSVMSDEAMAREMEPLERIDDNYRKFILTTDRFGLGSFNGIEVVNIIDWLCGR